MSQDRAKLDAIRKLVTDTAEQFSRDVFPVRPEDVKVSGADILAIIDAESLPERVVSIYDGKHGTVDRRTVPGFAWVNWDNRSRYCVSEDSLVPESELQQEVC